MLWLKMGEMLKHLLMLLLINWEIKWDKWLKF